jgi:hypothetical protein
VARNEVDGERYQCTVVFDNDRDSFDCVTGPKVGDRARIDGSSNGTCEAYFPLAVVVEGTDASPGAAQCTLGCRRKSGDVGPAPGGTPPPPTACPSKGQVAPGPVVGSPGDRNLLTGTNGQFQDRCTSDGNLVDYACDVTDASSGPPWHVYSGLVAASYYDCGGACEAGACVATCPAAGQTLNFESAPQGGYISVLADSRHYGCVITWDDPTDSFDCTMGIHSGTTGSIASPARSGNDCTAGIPEVPVIVDGATSSCAGCPECKLTCLVTR